MKCYSSAAFAIAISAFVQAQDIKFMSDPAWAMEYYAEQSPRSIGHCTDSLIVDTVYVETNTTREMEMVVQLYPLARYEFYIDKALYRRIDIAEDGFRLDTTWVEDLSIGEMFPVIQGIPQDIPNGAYHEFFPNGNIRIKGTLDGYNADGTLKKTGEWKEWDANGNVIRQETYP